MSDNQFRSALSRALSADGDVLQAMHDALPELIARELIAVDRERRPADDVRNIVAVSIDGMSTGQIVRIIRQEHGVTESTARRMVMAAATAGQIRKLDATRPRSLWIASDRRV